jgi:NADH dehydrogenase
MPLACPKVRFAPVYIGDVANAFVVSLENEATHGERIELCGPETLTLEELVKHTANMIGLRRMILPLSDGLSRTLASVLQFAPGKPMTPDNFRSMQLDSVCNCNGLAKLGIVPKSIDAIMPMHFQASNETGRLNVYRRSARRS